MPSAGCGGLAAGVSGAECEMRPRNLIRAKKIHRKEGVTCAPSTQNENMAVIQAGGQEGSLIHIFNVLPLVLLSPSGPRDQPPLGWVDFRLWGRLVLGPTSLLRLPGPELAGTCLELSHLCLARSPSPGSPPYCSVLIGASTSPVPA